MRGTEIATSSITMMTLRCTRSGFAQRGCGRATASGRLPDFSASSSELNVIDPSQRFPVLHSMEAPLWRER
jgi:hypothetical protein